MNVVYFGCVLKTVSNRYNQGFGGICCLVSHHVGLVCQIISLLSSLMRLRDQATVPPSVREDSDYRPNSWWMAKRMTANQEKKTSHKDIFHSGICLFKAYYLRPQTSIHNLKTQSKYASHQKNVTVERILRFGAKVLEY